jgi:hypothetical protein
MLIIKGMKDQASLGGIKLISFIHDIKRIRSYFNKISFFHIKREINDEVYYWTKAASSMDPSSIIKNEV